MSEFDTVYTYGGGKALQGVFNAIAAMQQDGSMDALMQVFIILGLIALALRLMTSPPVIGVFLKWFATYTIVVLLLMQPQYIFGKHAGMTIHIADVITQKSYKVDNLPPGLVIPASFISGMGYTLTKKFETLFSLPDINYLPYHEYGTMFGSRMMADYRSFVIQNPIFAENMENFMTQCVAFDLAVGRKYDTAELERSKDVWALMSDNASTLRMVSYRTPRTVLNPPLPHETLEQWLKDAYAKDIADRGGKKLITCKEAATKLTSAFATETTLLNLKLRNTNSPLGNRALTQALQVTNDFAAGKIPNGTNGTFSATDHLRQLLTINALQISPKSAAAIKAEQYQRTAWGLTGELAQTTLPMLHAIFQAIIYSLFPIVIPLLFVTERWGILKTYFGLAVWIELWPVLFAVLNLIVSVFAKDALGNAALTTANLQNVINTQSSYALCAASLGLVVPVLAYMILQGGVSSFMHIAGSVQGSTQAGIANATNETTSGNVSYDNTNLGNRSIDNTTANKYSTGGEIQNASIRMQKPDGSIQTDFIGTGTRMTQSGQNINASTSDISLASNTVETESAGASLQIANENVASLQKEISQMEQSVNQKGAKITDYMASQQVGGENYTMDISTSDGKAFTSMISSAAEKYKSKDFSNTASADLSLTGGISGGIGSGGIPSVGASVGLSATRSEGWADSTATGRRDNASANELNEERAAITYNALKNTDFKDTQTTEKQLAKDYMESYETLQSKKESLSASQIVAERAQQNYDNAVSKSFSVGGSEYQPFVDYMSKQQDPSSMYQDGTMGEKQAVEHINKRDEVFKKHLGDYMRINHPRGELFTPSKQQQYQSVSNNGVNYNDAHHQIKNTNVANDVDKKAKKFEQEESRLNNLQATVRTHSNNVKSEVENNIVNIGGKVSAGENAIKQNDSKIEEDLAKKEEDKKAKMPEITPNVGGAM